METEINKEIDKMLKDKFGANSSIMPFAFTKYNTPKFDEVAYKDWVNLGVDNLYAQYLVDKLNKSSTHNAIIQNKAKQIAGEGFTVQDSPDVEQIKLINSFIKQGNGFETFNDILRKVSVDQQVFGYWCLGIIWSNDRTKIAKIYHVDASTIRVGKPDEQTGEVDHYYFSEDWRRFRRANFEPKKIAKFNPNNRIEANQLLFVKKYRPDTRFYSLPTYVGCLNAIELEYELSNFQLNSVKHGLSPSMHISFNNGNPTKEERDAIFNSINNLYKGSDNAGKFFLSFNQSRETSPELTPIETTNLHDIYEQMALWIMKQIVVGHEINSPELVGINIPGELGGSNDLAQKSELFFNQYIVPEMLQIEEAFNMLLKINGFTLDIMIKDSQPISYQFKEETLIQILTLSELRAKIGYAPLSEEDKKNIVSKLQTETKAPISTEVKSETGTVTEIKSETQTNLPTYVDETKKKITNPSILK